MVSKGREFPARFAIACFQDQTYENRELVIVVDDPACELIPYVIRLQDDRIRLVEVPAGAKTLGELRNIAVASARGEYICQWDDDDLYAPERIQTQLAALLSTHASACVLRRWTLWWPDAKRLAISGVRLWEGSILALKRAMPPYPAWRRGEDTEMMVSLTRRERVLSIEAPSLYVYVHHANNTFNQQHFFFIYNLSRQRWINAAYWDKLGHLAETLPIRAYLEGLSAIRQSDASIVEPAKPSPLVSIIVRSMGRPELRVALESLAAQDYPALDIIVVDATGGAHPPLPEIAWRTGHEVRMVGGERPLPRAHAANVGIDAVRGAWFGFLDDDDSFDADHVSVLMAAAASTDKLVVYGMSRLVDSKGETLSLWGLPFNRAFMFHNPLLHFPTALIRRDVLDLGCRFDERFEINEDRDFFSQIAEYTDFEHVRHASFNCAVELGTSGTGRGANRDVAKVARYEQLLRQKWSAAGTYHTARTLLACHKGIAAYTRGDFAEARAIFSGVLRDYPDDINALVGLGFLALMTGDLGDAEPVLRRAVEINPTSGEARLHLATTLERTGRHDAAREEARKALSDPSVHNFAMELLTRLGDAPPPQSAMRPVAPEQATPSRMAVCPCGSGKRYKNCCGKLEATATPVSPLEMDAQRAIVAFRSGDAFAAIEMLTRLSPSDLSRSETALACGEICSELAHFDEAYAFFRKAAELGETSKAAQAVMRAGQHWYKSERIDPMRRMVVKQAERFNKRAQHPGRIAEIHIVANLGGLGGSEHHALGVYEQLSRHSCTRIWSTVPPLKGFSDRYPVETINAAQGRFPNSGHLVFVGTYFEYGNWLKHCQAHRITLSHNIDLPEKLIERLVELEEIPTAFSLDFSFPSRHFRDAVGVPGFAEYAPVDTGRFRPVRAKSFRSGPMIIGRHSRNDRLKFHPNDPAFFRHLAGLGHQIRITGGSCLAEALARKGSEDNITLLPETQNGIVEFLDGLDCFIYRIHPHLYETGGTVILEAMAMGLPVVLFGDRVGVAELVEHGRNGFIVKTEAEALACVGQLVEDPGLRRAMGDAARATIIGVMASQEKAMLDFYLPGDKRDRAAPEVHH